MKPFLKPTVRRLTSSPLQAGVSPAVKESWLEKEAFLSEREEKVEHEDGEK